MLVLFTVMLVVAQTGSALTAAHYPTDYRGYLESDEATVKIWDHKYGDTNILAAPFFAHERPLSEMHVNSKGDIRKRIDTVIDGIWSRMRISRSSIHIQIR